MDWRLGIIYGEDKKFEYGRWLRWFDRGCKLRKEAHGIRSYEVEVYDLHIVVHSFLELSFTLRGRVQTLSGV